MYKKMYYHLFNAATKAIELMEQQEFQAALDCLVLAQKDTEEIYMSNEKRPRPKSETEPPIP